MTFEEFRSSQQRIHEHRKHKITGSLGVYDAYKWIRKNNWLNIGRVLTEKEFYSIIRTVNNKLADKLISGEEITFPHRMGRLELRKYKPFIGYKDGKLQVKLAIDWDATLKLWYEDQEAFEEKLLIKIPEKEIFKVLYNKFSAHYTNQSFFDFSTNREIKRSLTPKIKNRQIDAFLDNG